MYTQPIYPSKEQAKTVTQEFHISVTPVRNDEYLVRTERVAPGVPLAEEQIVWEVDDWLAQAHQLMDDPLLGVLQGYDRIGETSPRSPHSPLSLVDLGQQLYAALFQGTLRDSWLTAQGIAQHRGEVLRLRLGLKGDRLPRLPWEVLHGGDGGTGGRLPATRPLAAGTDVIFSRYQPGIGMAGSSLPVEPEPLRILMAIAAPTDQEQLNIKQEALHLQRELRAHGTLPEGAIGSFPDIQVTILDQPGREQLTQALEQGNYQVFHFAGHSNLGARGGSLYLVNRRTGLTETLSGDDLAGLLVNNHIQMAVFNSCRGAYTVDRPTDDEDRNLAAALVDRGIPAVLAMAERIPDDVALTLTRLFYRNLKQGYPIDLSLSRARQGLISAYGSHQLYWALPILYLHPDFDGYLIGSDRSLDNPADSTMRTPRLYDPAPVAAADRVPALPDWQTDSFSESELLAAVDDLEYPDDLTLAGEEDDDRSMVAGLIEQLTQPPLPEAPMLAQNENLLPDADPKAPNPLPEPRYQPVQLRSPKSSPQSVWKRLGSRKFWVLGTAGAVTIALVGLWLATRRPAPQALPDLGNLPTLVSPASQPDIAALQRTDTPELTTIAVNHFANNELPAGQQAVEILLDRNALIQAESALASVRRDRVDSPAISFLRGRLAWQSLQVGNTSYSLDDARRYWEFATQGQPGSPQYHEALGFAYYAEGKSRDAIQAWLKALSLLQAQNAGQVAPGNEPADTNVALPTQLLTGKDALNAYAGIALALLQASTDPGSTQREELVSKAVKLYQMVNAQDPVNFQPDALAKSDWLWTQSAIQNWQKLSSLQQQ